MNPDLQNSLSVILSQYQNSFSSKVYSDENDECDILMNVFSLTAKTKRENAQYWGRELGMCWQKIVIEICKYYCRDFKPAFKLDEGGEPCDLIVGEYAIDTKYRIGSGEDATHKKLTRYRDLLTNMGYTPTLLILRTDSLSAAISACKKAKWNVLTGQESMNFIHNISGVDIKTFLEINAGKYTISRDII
jgi:hypothetical protein